MLISGHFPYCHDDLGVAGVPGMHRNGAKTNSLLVGPIVCVCVCVSVSVCVCVSVYECVCVCDACMCVVRACMCCVCV